MFLFRAWGYAKTPRRVITRTVFYNSTRHSMAPLYSSLHRARFASAHGLFDVRRGEARVHVRVESVHVWIITAGISRSAGPGRPHEGHEA